MAASLNVHTLHQKAAVTGRVRHSAPPRNFEPPKSVRPTAPFNRSSGAALPPPAPTPKIFQPKPFKPEAGALTRKFNSKS
jgi:hypothetical protein